MGQKLKKVPVTFHFYGMYEAYSAIILLEHGLTPPLNPPLAPPLPLGFGWVTGKCQME